MARIMHDDLSIRLRENRFDQSSQAIKCLVAILTRGEGGSQKR